MSAPTEKKQEADLSPEVDSLLPQAHSLAKAGKLVEALEKISTLEKKARNAADLSSTTRLLLSSLSLIRESPSPEKCDWDLLCETIVSLSKKHGQLKQAITRMVQQAFLYLHEPGWDPTPPKTKKQQQQQDKDEEMEEVEKETKTKAEEKKEEEKGGKKKLIGQGKKHQPTEKEIEEEERKMMEERQGKESVEITRLNEEARKIGNTGMNEDQRLKVIECLRNVTEGKIFVEVERARVTKLLSDILFSKGEVSKAADILQELAVETFGSMSRREKTEFIIEQMRLNAEREDWNRVAIVAKKINERFFKEEGQEDLKILYYDLMIRYALKQAKYLDVCKYHREIYSTPIIKSDPVKSKEVLRNVVVFCVLAPYDNEQNDLMHRIESEGDVEKDANEEHKNLLSCFTTPELMRWPGIDSLYSPILRSTPTFSDKTEDGKKRWEELHKRVVEHNIRVISLYYTRITISRLAELLDLPVDQAETSLADLVISGTVYAKIDRPAGVVSFAPKTSDSDKLNAWSGDMQKLLDYVETTSHLIHREMAVVRAGLTVKD